MNVTQEPTTPTPGTSASAATEQAAGPASGRAAIEARHRRIVRLQGGSLKMTLSNSTESVPTSFVGSAGGESVRVNIIEELEHTCVKQRTEIISPDGFISTPLHVVKIMSEEFKTPLHSEVFVINSIGAKIWRVDLYAGKMRGVGQAPLRNLAFQMAAVDMLEKIKATEKVDLPVYGLPPGCRICPTVMRELERVCLKNNLCTPVITMIDSEEPFEKEQMFKVVCAVGKLSTVARSDSRFMARRMACREMLETLSHDPFPDMLVEMGRGCVGLNDLREVGIEPLVSSKKQEWLNENRTVNGVIFYTEEDPDDGDLESAEDRFVFETAELPAKQELQKMTRVVSNTNTCGNLAETNTNTREENMEM